MAHLVEEEYLYGENIDKYFEVLANKIKDAGIGIHRILVVGGAAMALKYHDGRSRVRLFGRALLYEVIIRKKIQQSIPTFLNRDLLITNTKEAVCGIFVMIR